MTTIYKSINDTTVSALTAVGTVAQSISNTVTSAASALDMLDMFIQTAKEKQRLRTIDDMDTYVQTLLEESSADEATRQKKLQEKLTNDPDFKALFTENHNRKKLLLTQPSKQPE